MKEHAYPRIRDVRVMLRDIEELLASYATADEDFDRDFLIRVRDVMREADVELSTALFLVADEDEQAAGVFQGSL